MGTISNYFLRLFFLIFLLNSYHLSVFSQDIMGSVNPDLCQIDSNGFIHGKINLKLGESVFKDIINELGRPFAVRKERIPFDLSMGLSYSVKIIEYPELGLEFHMSNGYRKCKKRILTRIILNKNCICSIPLLLEDVNFLTFDNRMADNGWHKVMKKPWKMQRENINYW